MGAARRWGGFLALVCSWPAAAQALSGTVSNPPPASGILTNSEVIPESWNWHVQNTAIVQYHPGFPAPYAGPNSLSSASEVKETVSFDLYLGARLWRGAEAHADGLVWQGHGFSRTLGVEAFPNGEAFRLGTDVPNINLARLFVRQEFALGEEQEPVSSDAFHLAGFQSTSRLVVTAGKLSAKDVFDQNAYANDSRTQFMSWGLMANQAWDYPADSLGYITGAALELYLDAWCFRYGFFQMPRTANGTALDPHFLDAWGMVTEVERRFKVGERPGAVRLLAYWNRANMGSYSEALASPIRPADIEPTRAYRSKWGFALNLEQEICKDVGVFLRCGWNDGQTESWTFADVDRTLTGGFSVKGSKWGRPPDNVGFAGGVNSITSVHREFFANGGTGILAGDGTLSYASEGFLELFYAFRPWPWLQLTADYQFIANPAYNQDRGPVSVISGRLHWEF